MNEIRERPFTVEMFGSREEWLKGRANGIGASEVGIVLGISKYRSPFSLWARKSGYLGPEKPDERRAWGWRMEPTILRWLGEATGWQVKPSGLCCLRSKAWPWLTCSLDAWVIPGLAPITFDGIAGEFYEPFPGEAKNLDRGMAHEWKDHPPLDYWCQAQSQMAVTGAPVCVMACCIGGNEGRWFPIVRDERFIRRMAPRVQAFWQSIQDGVQPNVDGHETTRDALREMFSPPQIGKRVVLPQEVLPWVTQFDQATEIITRAKYGRDEAANRIRHAMETAEVAECPDGSGFTWKQDKGGKRSLRRAEKLPQEMQEVLE